MSHRPLLGFAILGVVACGILGPEEDPRARFSDDFGSLVTYDSTTFTVFDVVRK